MRPWRRIAGGVEVAVKVTPRAGRAVIGGWIEEADGSQWLAARVTAPPEGGRANAAALELLARALAVPPSACRLVAGAGGRRKRIAVTGEPEALASALARLTDG